MPKRNIDTGLWNEPWFEDMTFYEKALYIYLETNSYCPNCGIYTITIKKIARELEIAEVQVDKALRGLEPHVLYDRRINLIFVRKFVKHNRNSDKWLRSVETSLNAVSPQGHQFIAEFLQEYKELAIAYRYPMDRLCIAPDTDNDMTLSFLKEGGLGGDGPPPPPPREPKEAHDPLQERFFRFWEAYPHKMSKGQAEATWKKLAPSEQLLGQMLTALEQARTSEQWTGEDGNLRKKFIPYPSTWLNAKGWENEYTPRQKGGAHAKAGGRRIKEPGYDD